MSVQVDSSQPATAKKSSSLAPSKKRKHDVDSREAPKKKKKQRTEDADTQRAATEEPPFEKLKRKKLKSIAKATETLDDGGETTEPADVASPAVNEEPEASSPLAVTALGELVEASAETDEIIADLLESADPTSFYSTRISLYVSIPAVSLETAGSSILATHLAPLLLTYFPPAKGIVLGFSDPVLSAKPASAINLALSCPSSGSQQPEEGVFARTADEFGVCWTWLTATLLVFRPERGDELYGWTNVSSEGFIGLVSYNYFQAAVGSRRIPEGWKWNGPKQEDAGQARRKGRKGRLHGEEEIRPSQSEDGGVDDAQDDLSFRIHDQTGIDMGVFTDAAGSIVDSTLKYRVVDTEVVPAHDRHKWSLQIDGTLLDAEVEKGALEEERAKFERSQQRSRSQTPKDGGAGDALMSGARGFSREGSLVARIHGQTPVRSRG